jgi:hypothetical protein
MKFLQNCFNFVTYEYELMEQAFSSELKIFYEIV